jgi:hypothetical protein
MSSRIIIKGVLVASLKAVTDFLSNSLFSSLRIFFISNDVFVKSGKDIQKKTRLIFKTRRVFLEL